MKSLKDLKRNLKCEASNLPKIKISLLGDSSTQLLAMAICGEGYDRGYNVDLFEAGYNQVEQQIFDTSSDLHKHDADYTIIFQSTHKLLEHYSLLPPSLWDTLADERLASVRTLCNSLKGNVIYYNYPEIDDAVFGSYANKLHTSFIYQLRKLNFGLMNLAHDLPNLLICDLSALQAKYGRNHHFDSSVYVSTEMLLSIDALPLISSRTFDIISASQGHFHKCLVLDLDNTLWGGVVGDDGWENIQIGHGLGIGKAFTEFQQWLLKLKNRGIILCICSKNDEDTAKEPFLKNPEMVLKLDDIALFVANWNNKVNNLRLIQQTLNIGFDTMVFLDDNPFERNMIRNSLPEVTVPELPEDPADFLEFLYSLNLFETTSFSTADLDRTHQYQIEAQRISFARSFSDQSDFLCSLNMLAEVRPFDSFNIPRVAQLSQRSNQFNLRTVRYSEDNLTRISNNTNYHCFSFSLKDKFGDNGLICAIILREIDKESLFIDSWFMSCRVLKRGMEIFSLNIISEYAKSLGYKRIIGEYLPTAKNQMVERLLPDLGFTPITTSTTQYEFLLVNFQPLESYIKKL